MPPRSVFRDRESLFPKHIPKTLPHREVYMRMLHDLFNDFLGRPGEIYERVVQVYGPVGSGKSCTVNRFGLDLEAEARRRKIPLTFMHISCKSGVDSAYTLYQTILNKVAPGIVARGYSANEMLRQLLFHLKAEGKYLLLALDDVDYLVRASKERKGEGGIVFDLTRLNEMFFGENQNVIGVIFIARNSSYKKLLDPSEVSTLGNVVLRMPGYSAEQLADILRERVETAFRPGAVYEEVVDFVADLAAGKSYNPGDCRFALDILLTSGMIADAELSETVTLEHVRKTASESFDGISSEDLESLDSRALLTLLSTAQALRFHKTAYVSIEDIHEYCSINCELKEVKPLPLEEVKAEVEDLHLRGLLNFNPNKGVCIVGASLEDLERVLLTIERGRKIVGAGPEGND